MVCEDVVRRVGHVINGVPGDELLKPFTELCEPQLTTGTPVGCGDGCHLCVQLVQFQFQMRISLGGAGVFFIEGLFVHGVSHRYSYPKFSSTLRSPTRALSLLQALPDSPFVLLLAPLLGFAFARANALQAVATKRKKACSYLGTSEFTDRAFR